MNGQGWINFDGLGIGSLRANKFIAAGGLGFAPKNILETVSGSIYRDPFWNLSMPLRC